MSPPNPLQENPSMGEMCREMALLPESNTAGITSLDCENCPKDWRKPNLLTALRIPPDPMEESSRYRANPPTKTRTSLNTTKAPSRPIKSTALQGAEEPLDCPV
eukprot:764945-Hanusia_phi.AAC.1